MSFNATAEQLAPQDFDPTIELINALDEALESIEKGTEPTSAKAKIFKHQMKSGNEPSIDKPNNTEKNILDTWINMYRYRLDAVLFGEDEAKWFRRKN